MLRVGLTGGLSSGKSTAAHLFAALGVYVIQADEIGRELMQPGQAVFRELVGHFGNGIVSADGRLDRGRLAELAFRYGRLGELNRIVHPAVIAEEEARMAAIFHSDQRAIVMVESALIFEASGESTGHGGNDSDGNEKQWGRGTVPGWRQRFDRIILVIAADDQKVARYVGRGLERGSNAPAPGSNPERDLRVAAKLRLAAQIPDSEKIPFVDYVIDNSGKLPEMETAVNHIYEKLKAEASQRR
ncbi:MAG TPA: dephospho-CoA kinase [Acidisarcina sp.]